LFPYTTLFRSNLEGRADPDAGEVNRVARAEAAEVPAGQDHAVVVHLQEEVLLDGAGDLGGVQGPGDGDAAVVEIRVANAPAAPAAWDRLDAGDADGAPLEALAGRDVGAGTGGGGVEDQAPVAGGGGTVGVPLLR